MFMPPLGFEHKLGERRRMRVSQHVAAGSRHPHVVLEDLLRCVDATHKELRSCFRQSLVRHPGEDGRVAIVIRIGPDGRVAQVESYAACELAPEAISCMYGVARRLHFPPTPAGETVTLPATYTSRDGARRTAATGNDAFTAAAYVTIETARPALHACEAAARKGGGAAEATATFSLTVNVAGRVTKVDPGAERGDPELIRCASHALETLRFPIPNADRATVRARLNFNPRQGTR